jgi:hypothetical protein
MCSKFREVSSSDVRDLEQRGPNRLTQPVAHSVESNPVCLSYRRACVDLVDVSCSSEPVW